MNNPMMIMSAISGLLNGVGEGVSAKQARELAQQKLAQDKFEKDKEYAGKTITPAMDNFKYYQSLPPEQQTPFLNTLSAGTAGSTFIPGGPLGPRKIPLDPKQRRPQISLPPSGGSSAGGTYSLTPTHVFNPQTGQLEPIGGGG